MESSDTLADTPETDAVIETVRNECDDVAYLGVMLFARTLERERDGWREAAYTLAEALPPSWEELQPPAAQLAKFKEMVALQNEKTKKLLDIP